MTINNTSVIKKDVADFTFSAKVEQSLLDKIAVVEMEDLLNKNLCIANYSQKVKNIGFIFIAISPEKNIHPNRTNFYTKKGKIYIELALDYNRFAQATPKEAKQMMAELYLNAIKTYPSIRGMKKIHFDHEGFYTDLKALFEKEEWIGS